MKINQSFRIERPRDEVWALFEDVPTVSACMPGAELTGRGENGTYEGRVGVKLGPFNTAFEGEATVTSDGETYCGHVEGKGLDKRGGSRSQLAMDYHLVADGPATDVSIDADLKLTGPIAQFGRTGVITQAATVLIQEFVANIEAKLAATPVESPAPDTASDTAADADSAPPAAGGGAGRAGPPHPPRAASQISAFALLRAMLFNALRRLFGRA